MRTLPLLLALLVLPACSGGDDPGDGRALPAPSLGSACAPLEADLSALAEVSERVPESGALAPEDAEELELVQSGLAAAAVDLPEEVSARVDQLSTRIGLVRLASDAERLEAAAAQDLREGYQAVLDACAAADQQGDPQR